MWLQLATPVWQHDNGRLLLAAARPGWIAAATSLVMGNNDEGIPVAVARGIRYLSVDEGMLPIQESPDSFTVGVIFNIWCDIKLWWLGFYSKSDAP